MIYVRTLDVPLKRRAYGVICGFDSVRGRERSPTASTERRKNSRPLIKMARGVDGFKEVVSV